VSSLAQAEGLVRDAEVGRTASPRRRPLPWRRRRLGWLGLVPFGLYLVLFLALPTVLAISSGVVANGRLNLDNLSALADPMILRTFWNSVWLSLLTAVVGAVVGAAVCYALLGLSENGTVRTLVDAASGVLAQFGGVMLAFAFIATIGTKGVLTQALAQYLGIELFATGAWIYELPGLIGPYLYFQVPLMVITFMPAMNAVKIQWAEANLTLGGTRRTFWTHIGIPVLAPSFLASLLLLFANAFSSYATAAALASQGSQIVTLQIRTALTSETLLGRQNLAGVLALGMVVVVGVVMGAYAALQRRAAEWQS
jgi:putative spermidine/putrescine transport system permease protein